MATATREQSYIGNFWNSPEEEPAEEEPVDDDRDDGLEGDPEGDFVEDSEAVDDNEQTEDGVDYTDPATPGDKTWTDNPVADYFPGLQQGDAPEPADAGADSSSENNPASEFTNEAETDLRTTSSFVEQNKSVLAAIEELDARDAILKGILSTMQNQIFQLALRLGDPVRHVHPTADTVYRTDRSGALDGPGPTSEAACADFL